MSAALSCAEYRKNQHLFSMILGLSVNRTTGIELDLPPAWGQQAEIPNNRRQQVKIVLTVGARHQVAVVTADRGMIP